MRQYKRILSLLLALMMALTLVPSAAWAADDITVTQVVPCKYSEVYDFCEGLAAVKVGEIPNQKWGFIDTTGKEVVPCRYYQVGSFHEGLAMVRQGRKYGFVDTTGKEVIPCQYDSAGDFCGGLAWVSLDGKARFIDTTGKEVTSFQYGASIDFPNDGLTAVTRDGKWGFIDVTGKEVIPCQYESAEPFHNGYAMVKQDGKAGAIDTTGKVVVPFRYALVGHFQEGLAKVVTGDGQEEPWKWGYVDTMGNEVIPCQYLKVSDFSEGLAAVANRSSWWGFIDKTGKEVIPFQYTGYSGYGFSGGVAQVYRDGHGGLINTKGEVVVPFGKYEELPYFPQGQEPLRVKQYGKYGFIDATDRELVPCRYDMAYAFSEGLAAVSLGLYENAKWGFVDATSKEVVPCQYTDVHSFHEGFAAVELDGKWGFLSIVNSAAPAANTAYASTQTVNVDGKGVIFECYALKDEKGNPTNYIKLRDLAMLLNGSAAQFQVGWDGSVTITTKTAYTPNGSELSTPYSGDRTYQESNTVTKVNGQVADLSAFMLTDDRGGGYTYYQLRDLGQVLGFNVGWSSGKGIFIETDKPYDPNN